MSEDTGANPPEGEDSFNPADWSAREALKIVEVATGSLYVNRKIASRALAGLVRTRAKLFLTGERAERDVPIPAKFWWACGHEALKQSWDVGDFETWIDQKIRLRAYGVIFNREDIREMAPDAFAEDGQAAHLASKDTPEARAMFVGRFTSCARDLARALADTGRVDRG